MCIFQINDKTRSGTPSSEMGINIEKLLRVHKVFYMCDYYMRHYHIFMWHLLMH